VRTLIDDHPNQTAPAPTSPDATDFGGLAGSAGGAPGTDGFTTAKVDGKWFTQGSGGQSLLVGRHHLRRQFPATTVTDREHYFEQR
jgi:hypothetical protein